MSDSTDGNTTMLDWESWWKIYDGLKGSPWEDDDIADANVWLDAGSPDARPAAEAMRYVYDRARAWEGADPEDGVAAALGATYEHAAMNGWAPLWLKEMADHFAVFYKDMDDPLQDRLDDEYSRMPLEWLGDHGREELEKEVRKPSEIWVTEGPAGVWIFNKPGRSK